MSRPWQILLLAPPGYPHIGAFREVAETLHHAFRRLGFDAPIVLNHLLPGRRPLVLGFHLLPWLISPPALPAEAVIYNLEQLPGMALAEHPQLKLLLRHEVWDYSARNLDWLRGQGGRGRLLPVGWVPELGRIAVQPVEEVDVLFYGTMSPRRQAVLDALRARGLHVRYAYGVYGAERDALIGGAKLVLNLHNRGARIFELVRVSYLLANGRAVVAECDDATELPEDLRDGLCAVPYDALVDACVALVGDPAARMALGRRALAAMRRRDAAALLAAVLKADSAEDGSTGVPHPTPGAPALSRGERGLSRAASDATSSFPAEAALVEAPLHSPLSSRERGRGEGAPVEEEMPVGEGAPEETPSGEDPTDVPHPALSRRERGLSRDGLSGQAIAPATPAIPVAATVPAEDATVASPVRAQPSRPLRLAVVYDRLHRADTTGSHLDAALRAIGVDVVHYPPMAIGEAGLYFRGYAELPRDIDACLSIDDDLGYPTPELDCPSLYWCIDVHRMDRLLGSTMTRWDKLRGFDLALSAQRDRALEFGIPWLPLAASPGLIRPLDGVEKRYDWCFVGNINTPARAAALEFLRARLPNCFVGQAWGEEMNLVYNQSRFILNVSHANDVNMRYFEAQASGTPLVTNRVGNGEDELFDHLLLYDGHAGLAALADDLLNYPRNADCIGRAQRGQLLERHSYEARARTVLQLLKDRFGVAA